MIGRTNAELKEILIKWSNQFQFNRKRTKPFKVYRQDMKHKYRVDRRRSEWRKDTRDFEHKLRPKHNDQIMSVDGNDKTMAISQLALAKRRK
ncbi:hypothetical protein BLOT_011208 [Blomia tropicalis]|nr:hypothetical protein BLOT_011208 [Blomia tropicalis]